MKKSKKMKIVFRVGFAASKRKLVNVLTVNIRLIILVVVNEMKTLCVLKFVSGHT